MKRRLSSFTTFVCGLVVFSCCLPVFAFTCKDRRTSAHFLPAKIGRQQTPPIKVAFPLLCDTVEVPKGKMTEVEAGTMLAFSRGNSGNVIKVSGTLKLNGNKDTWVYLSGNIDSSQAKLEPGKATWGGIIVEPGGTLVMEYAGVWGAPTPVTAFSENVVIKNSFFTGSTGIFKPDGSILNLEPTFAALNDVNFAKQEPVPSEELAPAKENAKPAKPDGISSEEKERLLSRPVEKKFWTAGKIWGLTGLVVASGGGAAAYFYLKANPSPDLIPIPLEKPPAFPTD
jgi:hypothetical protein